MAECTDVTARVVWLECFNAISVALDWLVKTLPGTMVAFFSSGHVEVPFGSGRSQSLPPLAPSAACFYCHQQNELKAGAPTAITVLASYYHQGG